MDELKATRRVVDVAPPAEATEPNSPAAQPMETGDAMIVDRYGVMTLSGAEGSWTFRFDGLGQSVGLISFRLLPCQVLEGMETERRPSDLSPIRYRIAGVLTKFKGQYYILPSRVIRAYNNGNFAQ
jgi:hypothetical protein